MSIATELNRIQTAKANIKTAVANKGVTIPDDKLISEYAGYIDSISTGGINYPIYTCNLKNACCANSQLINDLNTAQILGNITIPIDTESTEIEYFDIGMENCFYRTTFEDEDPIALTNKIINAGNGNYHYAYINYAFSVSSFSGTYTNQNSTISFKNGKSNSSNSVYINYMFSYCNISNFKDIELDFTDLTSVSTLYWRDLFTGAITGNNGFKITNFPFSHISGTYALNSDTTTKVKIKKITSNGEKLRYDLNLKNIDMTRNVFMEFITSLGAVTSGTITIYIDTDVYNLLTSDDLAAVAAKNYTLSH